MKCPKCGAANPKDARFCGGCGDKFALDCPQCHSPNPVHSKFCENCGHALTAGSVTSGVAMPSPVKAPAPSVAQIAAPDFDVEPAQVSASASRPSAQATSAAFIPMQPTPQVGSTSTPPVAPEKSSSSLLVPAAIAGLLAVGAVVYMGMSGKTGAPVAASSSASVGVTSSPTVIPTAPPVTEKSEPVAAAQPATPLNLAVASLKAFPLNDIAPKVDAVIDAAKAADESGISGALDALKQIQAPQHGDRKTARAKNLSGLESIKNGNLEAAISDLAAAVNADPADSEVVNNLAYALEKSNHLVEARMALVAAISLAPTRSAAWANMGTISAAEGHVDNAVASFSLAFRFSQNQQKTLEYLQKLVDEHDNVQVRAAASRAILQLGK